MTLLIILAVIGLYLLLLATVVNTEGFRNRLMLNTLPLVFGIVLVCISFGMFSGLLPLVGR